MTDHPITPPPELVQQWDNECVTADMPDQVYIATQAARWGANQELEACCEWLDKGPYGFSVAASASDLIGSLRAARRPKPPSLKEQALAVLDEWCDQENGPGESIICNGLHVRTIRRALDALPDD